MAITMDGIFVNGQKVTFHPENILSGDASAYTEEIGTAVEEWLDENVTGGEQVTDTTLTLLGVPADAKKTGDEISDLKYYNSHNAFVNPKNGNTLGNLTWTMADGMVHAIGTTGNSVSFKTLYMNVNALPTWMIPGAKYYVKYSGVKVNLKVYDSNSNIILNTFRDTYFTVPDDLTGCIIRLFVPKNTSDVDEFVKLPAFLNAKSNADIAEELENAKEELENVKEDVDGYAYLPPIGLHESDDLLGASANYDGNRAIGVTFSWSADHSTCTVNGTPTETSFYNVYNNMSALPAGIEAGEIYYLTCATTNDWLKFQVFYYDDEEQQIDTPISHNKNSYIVIPSNAVGMIVRVRAFNEGTFDNDVISNMAIYKANDATGDIVSMLSSKGNCVLGKGVYPVRLLNMPDRTSIIGCGAGSILRFIDTGDGYTIKPSAGSQILNLQLMGGEDEPENLFTVGATLGTKHGIYLPNTVSEPFIMNGCEIINFDGSGIYAEHTGGSIRGSMFISNCYIRACMVGINLATVVEYNTFNAIRITRCNHACINNGGNNTFVGCEFHGVVGFYIDGSQPNHGHGSCVGCTFNHIDNTNQSATLGGGDAVRIVNLTNGFVFDGCQIWYGFINLTNSRGVKIADSQIGDGRQGPHITVIGTFPAFFSGCIFHQSPVIVDEANSKFDACYLDSDGSAITG